MSKRKLTRRIVIALASIGVLAVGAAAVTAATTRDQTTSRTPSGQPRPPVGEPTGQGSPPVSPCTLVTTAEAQAIDRTVSSAVQGRLGPTCIYRRAGNPAITLSVEQKSLQTATSALKKVSSLSVANHTGACAKLARDLLVVTLDAGHVLHLSGASCAIAQQFAAKALTRNPEATIPQLVRSTP